MVATNNALNITATGLVKYDGTGTFTAATVTQHDVLVGGTSNAITSVAPSSTSGVPLISQGSSSDPTFGTAVVAGGGTGDTSFTAYTPICGGTTTTGALQSVASLGSSGQVLTSNGAGALPTFQAVSGTVGFIYSIYGPISGSGGLSASTTYYLSNTALGNFFSSVPNTRYYIPVSGTITAFYGFITVGSTSTTEQSTIAIRLNDTTNTNVSTSVQTNVSSFTFNNTSLSIAVTAGNFIDILWITPAWVGSPGTLRFGFNTYIQ